MSKKKSKKQSPEEIRSAFKLIVNQDFIDELANEAEAERKIFQKKKEMRLEKERKEQEKLEKKMRQRELERQQIIQSYTPEQIQAVNDRRATFFLISNDKVKNRNFKVVDLD